MALGARDSDVKSIVVRQGLFLSGVGVAIGLLLALGLARLMSGLLFRRRRRGTDCGGIDGELPTGAKGCFCGSDYGSPNGVKSVVASIQGLKLSMISAEIQ